MKLAQLDTLSVLWQPRACIVLYTKSNRPCMTASATHPFTNSHTSRWSLAFASYSLRMSEDLIQDAQLSQRDRAAGCVIRQK